MNRWLTFNVVASLMLVACGCGLQWRFGSASVTRANGELTVQLNNGVFTGGSSSPAEEERTLEPFHSVVVRHGIDVAFESREAGSALVAADDNLLPLLQTEVDNGVLQVCVAANLQTRTPLRVVLPAGDVRSLQASSCATIAAEALEAAEIRIKASDRGQINVGSVDGELIELSASSSGRVEVATAAAARVSLKASSNGRTIARTVESKEVALSASSSGGVDLGALSGEALTVGASSNGRITVAGSVSRQTVSASSSGKYKAPNLVSGTAEVSCSSAGQVEVNADEIRGSASSAGKVRYHGGSVGVDVSTSSAGRVQKAG